MIKTDITVLLDRSGSMGSMKNGVIEGFNTFIDDQRKVAGEASVTLIQFDHEYDEVYVDFDIKTAPLLSSQNFIPRGGTALYDAIAKAIASTKSRVALKLNSKEKLNVLFLIITDGEENSSTEIRNGSDIKKMISDASSDRWEFVFLGANQDAIQKASDFGILSKNAMTYQSNSKGISEAYCAFSSNVTKTRGGGSFGFEQKERDAQSLGEKINS